MGSVLSVRPLIFSCLLSPPVFSDPSAFGCLEWPRPCRRPPPCDPFGRPPRKGLLGEGRAEAAQGPACLPHNPPSAAGSQNSIGLGAETRHGRCSSAAAGGPARCSVALRGCSQGASVCQCGTLVCWGCSVATLDLTSPEVFTHLIARAKQPEYYAKGPGRGHSSGTLLLNGFFRRGFLTSARSVRLPTECAAARKA